MVGSSVIGNGVGVNVGGLVGLGIAVAEASGVLLIGVAVASFGIGVVEGTGEGVVAVASEEGGAGITQAWRLARRSKIIRLSERLDQTLEYE